MLSLGLGTLRKRPSDFSRLSKFFLRKRASSTEHSLSLSRGGEFSGDTASTSSEGREEGGGGGASEICDNQQANKHLATLNTLLNVLYRLLNTVVFSKSCHAKVYTLQMSLHCMYVQ